MDERLFSGTHPRSLNFAVIFLMVLGAVWLTMVSLKLFGLRLDAVGGGAAMVQGLAAFAAAAALAARLRAGVMITAIASAIIVLGPLFAPSFDADPTVAMWQREKALGLAFTFSWVAAIWVGAAWGGRAFLVNPADELPRHLLPGLRALLARDRAAGLRLFVGLGMFLGGLALAPFLLPVSRKLVALVLLGAGAIFASGLSVSEEESPQDQN